jgi:hypothetical protein
LADALQRANQAVQHAADFLRVADQDVRFGGAHDLDAPGEFHLRLQFIARTVRKTKMVNVLGRVVASEAFGDIRRNGYAGLADFVSKNPIDRRA